MSRSAHSIRLALACIGVLGLGACANPGHKVAPSAPAPVAAAAPQPAPDIVEAAVHTHSRSALRPEDLGSLDNLSDRDLTARLGQPDFTRQEASAQIWQYRDASCVLELFLYPDGSDLKVAHAVTRSRTEMRAEQDRCMPASAAAS
jgi:hypothetical protein